MGIWHRRSKKKPTGAKLRQFRSKRKHEMGRTPTETLMGEPKRRIIDSKGSIEKTPALKLNMVNLTNPKTNETTRVELEDVEENKANMDYQRRKVITKGTIIKTPKGRAVVTSRPGQDGVINATLL
jgi:small subunit ribosomal protein S8e